MHCVLLIFIFFPSNIIFKDWNGSCRLVYILILCKSGSIRFFLRSGWHISILILKKIFSRFICFIDVTFSFWVYLIYRFDMLLALPLIGVMLFHARSNQSTAMVGRTIIYLIIAFLKIHHLYGSQYKACSPTKKKKMNQTV